MSRYELVAYGWPRDLSDEAILERLVALNRERAEEEKRGLVRWLRPEFQAPQAAVAAVQEEMDVGVPALPVKGTTVAKAALPKPMPERVAAVRAALARQTGPVTAADLARTFKGAKADTVGEVLQTLAALGHARRIDGQRYAP